MTSDHVALTTATLLALAWIFVAEFLSGEYLIVSTFAERRPNYDEQNIAVNYKLRYECYVSALP